MGARNRKAPTSYPPAINPDSVLFILYRFSIVVMTTFTQPLTMNPCYASKSLLLLLISYLKLLYLSFLYSYDIRVKYV